MIYQYIQMNHDIKHINNIYNDVKILCKQSTTDVMKYKVFYSHAAMIIQTFAPILFTRIVSVIYWPRATIIIILQSKNKSHDIFFTYC